MGFLNWLDTGIRQLSATYGGHIQRVSCSSCNGAFYPIDNTIQQELVEILKGEGLRHPMDIQQALRDYTGDYATCNKCGVYVCGDCRYIQTTEPTRPLQCRCGSGAWTLSPYLTRHGASRFGYASNSQ